MSKKAKNTKESQKKKCNHVCGIERVTDTDFLGGVIHQYWVNGNVCIKCGELLAGNGGEE